VIDIGCGCGDTSIEIARIVRRDRSVLGIDVSQPMPRGCPLAWRQANCPHLAFRNSDASEAELPANVDLLFSRFGVMFFSRTASRPSITLRKSLRTGGRCVFVCWRAPRDNAWAMTPLVAARRQWVSRLHPPDPNAPGPFAFADENQGAYDPVERRLRRYRPAALRRGTLSWRDAAIRRRGRGADRAGFALCARDGRRASAHRSRCCRARARSACRADGQVSLNGSTWIVSATNSA
jgi:SAM-dependent methyltransferase